MRKSRFTDEQIVAIVREAETHKGLEVCRRHGISKETLRRWRTKYRGMGLADARRLKVLEDQNRRLKSAVPSPPLPPEAKHWPKRRALHQVLGTPARRDVQGRLLLRGTMANRECRIQGQTPVSNAAPAGCLASELL